MKLYNVYIEQYYNTSYEGDIDTSYSSLVIADSEKDAIEFIRKDLGQKTSDNLTAKEVHCNRATRKRKTQYYNG